MEQVWRGETLKAKELVAKGVEEEEEKRPDSTPRPTPPAPAPHSACPRELCIQTRLQSLDVLADEYEAEVSMMMERIGKTRKHSSS